MKHLDLFSGIGGFALAAERIWGSEYENVGFVDNDVFCQAILKKHYPSSKIYDDIRTLRTPPTANLVTGGFPCQPFSSAGKRRGTEDDRHLWPEMLRIIRLSAPEWVVGENVSGLLTWNGGLVLDQVLSDLEDAGYEVWPFVIPACALNAPHRRDRVWIVAHSLGDRGREGRSELEQSRVSQAVVSGGDAPDSERIGRGKGSGDALDNRRESPSGQDIQDNGRKVRSSLGGRSGTHTDPSIAGLQGSVQDGARQRRQPYRERSDQGTGWEEDWASVATRLCALDDGVSPRLVRPRGWRNAALKAAGNAIVPQVAMQIFKAIKTASHE